MICLTIVGLLIGGFVACLLGLSFIWLFVCVVVFCC